MVANLAEASISNVPPQAFLRHYQTIRDCKRKHEDAGMALARAKKAAKGDGIDLDALKLLEKLSRVDPDEAEVQLKHLREYAAWIGLPIGTQMQMFAQPSPAPAPSQAALDHQVWEAGDEGHRAGRKGSRRDENPYLAGSARHDAWDRCWLDGQRVIADEMLANGEDDTTEETDRKTLPPPGIVTAKSKRGRPKANGNGHAHA